MGDSIKTPFVIDDDESEGKGDDDNVANDNDHYVANEDVNVAVDDDRGIANDCYDNIADDDDDAVTNVDNIGLENATSKQHTPQDDKQIEKLDQSDNNIDDQDNNDQGSNGQDNGQDNGLDSHSNKGSRPAKRRRLGPSSSDPDLDCNYKHRTQPTRECRLRNPPWPERAYAALDRTLDKRPSSVRSKASTSRFPLGHVEQVPNTSAEYQEWPMGGFLKRIMIGNEIQYSNYRVPVGTASRT